MKVYKHAFSTDYGVAERRVVYSLAPGPVEAAILAQAFALRRGLPWKHFKQVVEGTAMGGPTPFAWNDEWLTGKMTPEQRVDNMQRRSFALAWHAPQRPTPVAAAYSSVGAGVVEFTEYDAGVTDYTSRPRVNPLGRAYTAGGAARIAWVGASNPDRELFKDTFLSRIGAKAVDINAKLSVTDDAECGAAGKPCARISIGSRMFRVCQEKLEAYLTNRQIPWEKVSSSAYLLQWELLMACMGTEACHACERTCRYLGVR